MKGVTVIKHNGQKESYERKKVLDSILRSGIKKETALKILAKIEAKLEPLVTTRKLYHWVGEEITRRQLPRESHLYHLREALAAMDSLSFEKFIEKLLEKQGFQTKWNEVVPGLCSPHQIDIIASDKKGSQLYVEVKHHRRFHRDTDLGTVVEIWGRLDDLQKGYQDNRHQYNFRNAWLVTNTKFSAHAKKYVACKKLKLTGWRYSTGKDGFSPQKKGLEDQIKILGLRNVYRIIEETVGS